MDVNSTGRDGSSTPRSFLLLSKAGGADGVTPPGFLFPVKEQVASLQTLRTHQAVDNNRLFWYYT